MKKFDADGLGFLLGGAARAWRLKLDHRLKPMGLSQARWRTLLLLSLAAEPLTQSQIAENLGIEEPTLATLLHRLEKEGWVARKSSALDRRCKTVHLQKRAHRLIGRIDAAASDLRRELIREIPARELQTCMRVLDKVRERAERRTVETRNGGRANAGKGSKWRH